MNKEELFKGRIREALQLAKRNGYTQAKIGEEAGVSPQAVGQWPRSGKVSSSNLAVLARLAGKPLDWFYADTPSEQDFGPDVESRAEQQAKDLAMLASPRSEKALQHIAQAAREGRLTEDDLLLLERIAKRIAAAPPDDPQHNKRHERLKKALGNDDPSTDSG